MSGFRVFLDGRDVTDYVRAVELRPIRQRLPYYRPQFTLDISDRAALNAARQMITNWRLKEVDE